MYGMRVNVGHAENGAQTDGSAAEDFALSEASYGIIKIIQTFPDLRLPPSIEKLPTGQETQNLTLVVSSAEGCKVLLR